MGERRLLAVHRRGGVLPQAAERGA